MKKLYKLLSYIVGCIIELLCISRLSIHKKTPLLQFLIKANNQLLLKGGIYD